MDYEISWSPEALDDIDDIAEFHHNRDPLYAQAVIEELVSRSRTLSYSPLRGRQVPELEGRGYREIFAYSYRLIYRVQAQGVAILAVIPGKMPMDDERFNV